MQMHTPHVHTHTHTHTHTPHTPHTHTHTPCIEYHYMQPPPQCKLQNRLIYVYNKDYAAKMIERLGPLDPQECRRVNTVNIL